MKTLYILRHAKSSWTDPELSDFDRPLNERGLRTAPFMGGLMKRKGLQPHVTVSSPAARARATAELVKEAADLETPIIYDDQIYEASPQRIRQVVAAIDDTYPSALLVGHNPGIEGFIFYLTGRLEAMPTAALAIVDLNIDSWDMIDAGRGELQALYRPKEEMK